MCVKKKRPHFAIQTLMGGAAMSGEQALVGQGEGSCPLIFLAFQEIPYPGKALNTWYVTIYGQLEQKPYKSYDPLYNIRVYLRP